MKELSKEKHYLLGCSGGPDSMALFHMLLKNNINFDVAFVNYHKRKESVIEEEAVKKYCKKHNVKFHLLSAKGEEIKGNFQAWAREFRYDFFEKIIKESNYEGVLIAHHQDDVLETYIFQKTRGGLYNYFGLKEESFYKDIKVIRPLLEFRKKDLLQYCIDNNVPYFIDSSNLTKDYSRNKIRHEIVEELSDEEIAKILKNIVSDNAKNEIEIKEADDFYNKDKYLVDDFLQLSDNAKQRVLYKLTSSYKNISGKGIKAIIEFVSSDRNGEFNLIDNIFVSKDYGEFSIFTKSKKTYEIIIEKPQVYEDEMFYVDFINGKDALFIKEDPYPLKICNAKKDEVVKIGNITKKVNRLFIDEKIPNVYRDIWPVIKDKTGKIIFFPRKKEKHSESKLVFRIKL